MGLKSQNDISVAFQIYFSDTGHDLTKIPTISTFLDDSQSDYSTGRLATLVELVSRHCGTHITTIVLVHIGVRKIHAWHRECLASGESREKKKGGGDTDTTTTPPSLQDPHERQFDPQWTAGLGNTTVRYFSGAELTRLMGFASTSSFSFPPDCTTKQQWKLVGNSVHVDVVAKIVQLGQWVPGCTEASMDGARLRLRRSSRLLDTRAVAIPNDIPPSTDPSARRRNQVEGFRA